MTDARIKEEKIDDFLSDDEELNKILEDVQEEANEVLPPEVAAAQPAIPEDFLNELDEEENRIIKSLDSDVVVKEEGPNKKDNGQLQQMSVKKEKDLPPVADDAQLSETFLAELDKEVESLASPNADDTDIQMLQALIAKRKKELGEIDETIENAGRSGSKSTNQSSTNVNNKRKADEQSQGAPDSEKDGSQTRKRPHVDEAGSSGAQTQNKSASSSQLQADVSTNRNTAQLDSQSSEQELERLLKADDSDEDMPNFQPEELLPNVTPPVYGFPNAFQMGAPMFDPGIQMMGGMQPPGYPMMYNMGMQPGYYPPNMGAMPMMGYGMPHMPVNEVQCLPVVNNAGYSGIPSFKRIKLEKVVDAPKEKEEENEVSAEDRRRKVFEACSTLLEQLEFSEPSGKFTFTPTVTKYTVDLVSNSIVQKISNVSYDFHSIGPKQNISDWGLKEIGSRNCDIAKKIGISAEKYFLKIAEKADTIARKLIKVEDSKTDATEDATEEMEVEEPTLSTFLKNSMTQTDKLICGECVERKRKVGHNIACQATVYTGSIGSQTSPDLNDDHCLSTGLNENQLKALYEFSSLIREPPKNTVIELNRLRERLIIIYNLSQRQNKQPLPNVSLTDEEFSRVPRPYNALGGQSIENVSNNVSNRFLPPGRQMQNVSHGLPHPMQEARNAGPSQNIQVLQNRQMPVNTYLHPGIQFPRSQQPAPPFFRAQQPASTHAYQQPASQFPRMVPAPQPVPVSGYQQRQTPGPQLQRGQQSAPQYPVQKMPSLQDPRRQPTAEQGARKGFGRGNQR